MLTPVDNMLSTTTSQTLTDKLKQDAKADNAKLKDACQQFESYMLSQLFSTMRASIPEDGLLPRSQGEKIFQEMLDGEYTKEISRSQSIGIASLLYRQLSANSADVAVRQDAGLHVSGKA
ncbi:MAG TPA: rod-binding protein [Armatimonadota bacterium]|nr:rod-binding protein [Armatimonadota bacterium]